MESGDGQAATQSGQASSPGMDVGVDMNATPVRWKEDLVRKYFNANSGEEEVKKRKVIDIAEIGYNAIKEEELMHKDNTKRKKRRRKTKLTGSSMRC